ncbi:MAG: hypothetical protein ABI599_09650 [Flavobacteriales bacterium]
MFAKRLRPLIAMLLLGVLSLVVLPRELFHDCALEHAHANAPADGAIVSADCPICHQALPVYQGEAVVVLANVRALIGMQVRALSPQILGVWCEAPSSRGPPMS